MPDTPAALRAQRLARAKTLAARQEGVLSRAQLYGEGMSRAEVKWHLRVGRWRAIGRHCVVVHTGPLTRSGQYWAAVLEGGPRALLDGESSLVAGGLEHYEPTGIRVSVPRGARTRHRRPTGDIRQTRRWASGDAAPGSGVPRTRNAVAAVRAALWATTERQAALLLTMTVQQGLASVADIGAQVLRIRRDKRRAFIHGVLIDLAGGVRSLGELDFVRGCRQRGIPEPDAQALRRTRDGTFYLDFRWERWGVVLEVDGIQHTWAQSVVAEALRQNSIAIEGDVVLRLPLMGLRVCPDAFFDQVVLALVTRGWGGGPESLLA